MQHKHDFLVSNVFIQHKVDWLSWKQPVRPPADESAGDWYSAIEDSFWISGRRSSQDTLGLRISEMEMGAGRYPFAFSLRDKGAGITIFINRTLRYMLCEASGRGCDHLVEHGTLMVIIGEQKDNITRLDIATDIENTMSADEYVMCCPNIKTRSQAQMKGESGETFYLGSPKSEKFVRVYRYNEPHPRHRLLRVEQVLRRAHARAVAQELVVSGVERTACALGDAFGLDTQGWFHSGVPKTTVPFPRSEGAGSSTVLWLIKQAAPSFRRMVQEGKIADAQAFLNEFFLD